MRAVRSRIATKLTVVLVGVVGVTLLVAGLGLNAALETFAVEAVQARLATGARLLERDASALLAGPVTPAAAHAFAVEAARTSEARVTVIAPDGRVLGDSEVRPEDLAGVQNHAGRREVRAALAGRLGHDLRRSVTTDTPLFYVAIPVTGGGRPLGVLRLALPLSVVTSSYAVLHRVMLVGALVALVVALGVGVVLARRITRPLVEMQAVARRMSDGDFSARARAASADEIGALARALNTVAARLRDKIQDLEHEQATVTAILEGMVEGVVAVDDRDHVVWMNDRARAIFELGDTRPAGKPFLEVVRNRDLHRIFREGRDRGPGTVLGRELRLAGTAERVLQVNAVTLPIAGGVLGVVTVLHDITELRRLEQVRTEFVANVSHELRTPLTAIRGYLETLLDEPRIESARPFLEIAFRHAERLGRLLDDLTDLSNIELGKVELRRAPVRLVDAVEEVVEIVAPKAADAGVDVALDVSPELPPVFADHDRLVQILLNLVDNAVKYTPRGGALRVSAHATDAAVSLVVADTGVGIPREHLPRITERFYRVDRARSRELGGTGLGLAIVKHLVSAHGGTLAITSEPGHGTSVTVTLSVVPPG